MNHYITLAIKTIFTDNMILAYFLGMCSFLACSKQIKTATGLAMATTFISTMTVPMNWLLKAYVLKKGALAWAGLPGLDLSYLSFILFIATIAALNQITEMIVDRFAPALYATVGIFLPLITANCAVLGATFFMDQRDYTFGESLVFGFSSGAGWGLAIITLAALRKKLWYSNPPAPLKGLGITMMTTGFMAMAFMAFAGIAF
ncbi:MAG: NADH:ubiquinone reductase (Na(+)-transporting) subunit E [Candidatus Omnitrophica bacterium]|nr:NADH:ubiquinone reductase (Na(+)-transporting) subunit E [Candidatus Omnitrophota bacterium]